LHEAAKLGFTDISWPQQYIAGKLQLERNLDRERQVAAASRGMSPQEIAAKLLEG
jgi:anthraniloyl-CoA monooxygenase